VGTITEIYDYLRLLFARAGEPRCPDHNTILEAQTVSQMVDQVLELPEGSRYMLLAPVVQNRKGEHLQLLNELRVQGYVRVRIDGVIIELDVIPEIDKKKKHTIEVVIDRFKIRDDLKQRLAESFETALVLSDGIALAAPLDDGTETLVFSAKFACTECGYSLQELEPRLFSFNNPSGACPTCDGLGNKQFFDIDRVVSHPDMSLREGAVRNWDRKNSFYSQLLESLAKHYDFDLDKPFKKLTKKQKNIVIKIKHILKLTPLKAL